MFAFQLVISKKTTLKDLLVSIFRLLTREPISWLPFYESGRLDPFQQSVHRLVSAGGHGGGEVKLKGWSKRSSISILLKLKIHLVRLFGHKWLINRSLGLKFELTTECTIINNHCKMSHAGENNWREKN